MGFQKMDFGPGIRSAYVIIACFILSGCVKFDNGVSWAPDMIRDRPPSRTTVAADPRPDIDALMREHGAEAFLNLQSIRVSDPTPDGRNWQFCAEVSSAGAVGGTVSKTYLVRVVGGVIDDRREVSKSHFCSTVSFHMVAMR
jgi:hypothetical protein